MALRVAVVGAGPAGFAVAAALLADDRLDVAIDLVDRAALPDQLLRHGPAAGARRLSAVAGEVDAVLADSRVAYFGNLKVGTSLGLEELRSAADVVVMATGAPLDLPLEVAGCDSVGIGTITHVEAWLAGSPDVDAAELDLDMDTAVLIGASQEAFRTARVLCGFPPAGVSAEVSQRIVTSRLRHVQLVDPRIESELDLPQDIPENLVIRTGLRPIGVVGRNRARALRCLHTSDQYGRVVSEDLRAQLLLRPRTDSFCWRGIDEVHGRIAHRDCRALREAAPVPGLYVAGWAARDPHQGGSHADDAAAVVAAIRADCEVLPVAQHSLADLLARRDIAVSCLGDWSATVATDALLARFAGEGKPPLADYDVLLGQADQD